MSHEAPLEVTDVVARFFESRRAGCRVSIDEVLGSFHDLADPGRTRVEALHEIARRARTVELQPGSSENVGDLSTGAAPPTEFPELAGYDIVDVLGRGGMGVVYEAYQQSTGRRVAIKFMLQATARSEAARRRFEREVELVARLQHPDIVAVIDSGIDRDRYYYVMEYVDGRALDEAFTLGECDPRSALGLIADVADAVDYAHQRGVLHRDLKPSNVMIDERGRPRLLDFGLAKAIDPDSAMGVNLSLSEPGQLVGTLAYMSPEQSRGEFEQMSVRSDVYSLGAMTYELLTGRLPCDVDGPLPDVLNRIADREAARPSTLRPGLDADVDAILLKALEKLPRCRYPTAGEFSSDLRRYLADEPIIARRAGPVDRLSRWVRRNRGIAGVSAASLLLIVVIITVAFFQIMAERDRAVARGEKAQRMMHALEEMLAAGDPDDAPGADISLAKEFDRWESQLDEYRDEPEMEAGLRLLLGRICLLHSEHPRGERNLQRALTLLRDDVADPDPLEVARVLHVLGKSLHRQTRFQEAESYYREALEIRRREYGPPHGEVAGTLTDLGCVVKDQDRLAEAEALYHEALDTFDGLPPDQRNEFQIASTMNNLGLLLSKSGRYEEAERLLRETLELRRKLYDSKPHQHLATSMANLGTCLRQLGKFEESETFLRDALAMRADLFHEQHTTTIVSMNLLGLLLKDRGSYAEAEQVLRGAHDLRVKVCGPKANEHVAMSKHNLAAVLIARGKYSEAEELLLDAIDISMDVFPNFEQHRAAAYDWHALADLYRAQGDYARARELCAKALAIRQSCYAKDDHTEIGSSLFLLGRITLDAGDPLDAESLLRRALEILRKLPEGHWRPALCESVLGESLAARGRFSEAEDCLTRGFETLRRRADLPNPDTLAALRRLIDLYDAWEKPDQARIYRALLPRSEDTD